MRRRLGVAACIWSAALGCGGDGTLATEARLYGRVVDVETAAPLEGVRIRTGPVTETAITDADGCYALSAQLGVRYQVTAELEGFGTRNETFTPSRTSEVSSSTCAPGGTGAPAGLDFSLELVPVCAPGSRRCVRGTDEAAVEICAERGNLWTREPCAGNQACDPATGECRDLAKLFVILDAPGGVIRSQPVEGQADASINCGTQCEADFFRGTEVTLVATPLARATFTGWRGMMCSGTDPVCTVVLDQEERVGGGFSATAFGLTVSRRGAGEGTVVSTPAGIDCPDDCEGVFDRDAMVTLTAMPAPGSVFARWEQNCSDSGANRTCTLTMDDNKRARARFVEEGIAVEVLLAGAGVGTVTSDPEGIDCGTNCLSTFEAGRTVTLTASAAAGSTFTGWTGDCTGTDPTCQVDADVPRQVTATFDGVARTLTVERGGNGRITSTPAGIDCGATCAAPFAAGAQVELTAAPDPGFVFVGWSLDCAGLDPRCPLTMDADRRARADFVPYYLAELVEDADCIARLPLDAGAPAEVRCGAAVGMATIIGGYPDTPGRVARLAEARLAMGPSEEGYIDVGRLVSGPRATVELSVRKAGPAFNGRGRAALVSDLDLSAPAGGLRLLVLDDGQLAAAVHDGLGGTVTASAAPATIGDGTWYHVAVTVDPANGLGLFVDGMEVARTPGPVAWTASSSTAWVGAEREGPAGDAIHRFNGALDEVRVSSVVRY